MALSTPKKVLLVVGATLGFCILSWVALVGAVYALGGVVSVRVDSADGPDFSFPVPLAAVDVALATGSLAFEQAHVDVQKYTPMLRELLEVIEDCPDVMFVEIEDHGDEVRISKRNGRLRVEVRERGKGGVNVEVSAPVRSVARLLS